MRISRNKSPIFTRRHRKGTGCLPLFVLIGVAVSVVALGRNWIGQWLSINHPQYSEVNLTNAQTAFNQGDLATTLQYASQLLENDPANDQVLILMIRALIYHSYSDYDRAEDRQHALMLSNQGLVSHPRNLDVQAIRAYALQANGQSDEASRIALRIIHRSPEHIMARMVLSLSYGSQGIFEAAIREANVAVQLANQYQAYQMESYRVLAIAYSDLANYEQAILSVNRALDFNPKLIPLHFERALYAIQFGNTDQATVSYFQIMAFDENNVKVRLRLCELSSSLQERDAAIRYCGEVTEHAPEWSDGWYQLGREFFLDGDFVNAQASFNRCSTLQIQQEIAISDRQFECWYLQGQSAEILGDCYALLTTYHQFIDMAERADIPQTWTYPPEGPPVCADIPPTVTAISTTPSR